MNFIKQIFENKVDDYVHSKFVRYGKGEYERALINVKRTSKNIKVKTSYDFSNDMFRICLDYVKGSVDVSGKIIADFDLQSKLGLEANYTKRGKLHTAELKCKLSKEQLEKIWEDFRFEFLLLNIKGENVELKCGSSLPKPGGTIKDDFCKASLPVEALKEFDLNEKITEANLKHIYQINELAVPKEYENNFEKARIFAKRKGFLIRKSIIDGKEEEKKIVLNV